VPDPRFLHLHDFLDELGPSGPVDEQGLPDYQVAYFSTFSGFDLAAEFRRRDSEAASAMPAAFLQEDLAIGLGFATGFEHGLRPAELLWSGDRRWGERKNRHAKAQEDGQRDHAAHVRVRLLDQLGSAGIGLSTNSKR
jgi:hypothetical protein